MGHDPGLSYKKITRAALLAAAALALAACAAGPRQPEPRGPTRPSTIIVSPSPAGTTDGRMLMIDSATAMLGQPYHWGGAAPGGFDCSGLVFYAAAGAGIRVPRTAAEQYDFGQPIRRSDLRAGDLIFMHLAHKELHVAIALDSQRFIHAPSSGGFVRIDSLDAHPYTAGFVGARRILPIRSGAVSFASPN
jgi:cell wall-associated NlpC family hydrolase